jgi:hypothetical protein
LAQGSAFRAGFSSTISPRCASQTLIRGASAKVKTGEFAMSTLLGAALAYWKQGFSVIPIAARDKKPLTTWEVYQTRTPTEEEIKASWSKWPDGNIGIVTGSISRLVVIDLDTVDAKDKLKKLLAGYDLQRVPRSRTGKGFQLFFKHPGVTIPNRAGIIPGLDVRGDGGYVVVPPSVHPNGKQYHWEVPLNSKLPELPDVLLRLIQTSHTTEQMPRHQFNTASALRGVPEGKRDQIIFQLACKLRAADVPQEAAETLVIKAARNCDPPFNEKTAVEKVRIAFRKYPPREQKQVEMWPEFQSAAQILDEPDELITWRWDNCLPLAGSSIVVASPKVGKTTFATNLALAVARGLPLFGRSTQQCPVAFAYLDGPRREIIDAFKKLGLNRTDPIFVHAGAAPRDYVEWIMAQVEEHGVRFVIIDTFQKFFRISNINDYSEVVNKSEPMLAAAATKQVHLMFLHHAGKGDRGDLDSAIGSTAIRGQAQSYLHLKLLPGSTRRIFRSDQRHGQGNFPEVAIGFNRLGWLEIAGTREEAEIQDTKPKIRELLESEDGELTEDQIRKAIPARAMIVSKALRQLFKNDDIERSGEGKKGKPYRYRLAASLHFLSGRSENSSPRGESMRGGILGHESKNQSEVVRNQKKDSSPELLGHERDTNGHESLFETGDTRIGEQEIDTKKDSWEPVR